jgi:hypothetical protein
MSPNPLEIREMQVRYELLGNVLLPTCSRARDASSMHASIQMIDRCVGVGALIAIEKHLSEAPNTSGARPDPTENQ